MQLERLLSSSSFLLLAVLFLSLNGLAGLLLGGARFDLTDQGLYSLSKGTKEIISSIEDPIQLQFFFSEKATRDNAALRSYAKRVRELLEEYTVRAGDKIILKIIDPEPFSEAEERATRLGIRSVQGNAGSEAFFFGLVAIDSLDRHRNIPLFDVNREINLEYDISKLISSLLVPSKPVVGVISSIDLNTGGIVPTQGGQASRWSILNLLSESFRVQQLDSELWKISSNVDVLMVVRPSWLPDNTIYAIDQYVLNGGKALVLIDTFSNVSGGGEKTYVNNASKLPRLLDAWGLSLEPYKVAGDPNLAIRVQVNGVAQRHPAYLGLTRGVISEADPVTALLESINIGSAGHLTIKDEATEYVKPLFTTTDRGGEIEVQWLQDLPDAAELRRKMRRQGLLGKIPLAVRVQGPASSRFTGPPEIEGSEDGTVSQVPNLPEHKAAAEEINVIVVSDADMIHGQYWLAPRRFLNQVFTQTVADNGSFIQNALENLSGSSALISVRSRGRFSRPFEVVEEIRQEADQRYRERSEALERRLRETEQQLADLRSKQAEQGNRLRIRSEKNRAINRFNSERTEIRREIREVRHQLNKDIDSLNTKLRAINIVVAPPIFVIIMALLWRLYSSYARGRRRLV